jgi:hypothetical protein
MAALTTVSTFSQTMRRGRGEVCGSGLFMAFPMRPHSLRNEGPIQGRNPYIRAASSFGEKPA